LRPARYRGPVTTTAVARVSAPRRSPAQRYWRSLWLLTMRDLRVRYTTSFLGYLWSVIDPLLMSGIYFFVFVVIFDRKAPGEDPYIVFLVSGLLPWTWFSNSITDCTKAFTREAKLLRSTTIPRTIWVARMVLSKGIEFLISIPVLIVFVIATGAPVHWTAFYWLLAIVLQAILLYGIGLIVAPLVVFFRDLERAIRLLLRVMFYASAVVYSFEDLEKHHLGTIAAFNPLTGIMGLYRSAFFPQALDWFTVGVSAVISVLVLVIGVLVFRRSIPTVLKEI
jgi:ABC-2 type transport system permease protein